MLFDLRGRGRRRTVRVIYIGLAVLIGVGLVGFGIGGGFGGGGLLNAAEHNGGSGGVSFSSQIKKYRKLTEEQPANLAAWEGLVKAQVHEASGEAYISNGQLTSKGRELYSHAASSWRRYLALNPPKPNVELSKEMVRVFGQEGLNEPAEVVQLLQIAIAAEPTSASLYGQLAQYAYLAHNTRVGDLAAAKAVSLAPAELRARVKLELAQAKKSASSREGSTGGATGGVTTGIPAGGGTPTGATK